MFIVFSQLCRKLRGKLLKKPVVSFDESIHIIPILTAIQTTYRGMIKVK